MSWIINKFRKRKIPPNWEPCDICGEYYPPEELHTVILYFSTKVYLKVCDNCIEKPPSQWRIRTWKKRRKKKERD